jgi:outer membrane protein assembly factor BamB
VGLGVADGTLLWETPYAVSGRGYNAATPIVAGQTVIYTGSNRGAKAVKLAKQGDEFAAAELWSNDDNSVQFNTPVLKDDLLFGLSNRDVLFCINAESGETAWTAQLGARQRAADRPEGGARPGRRGRGGGGGNRQGYGSIVDAGSVVFALTPAAQLTVFEPSDTEFKQLASYQVSDSQTFAYPIVAGNRLFVKDENSVTLWTIE